MYDSKHLTDNDITAYTGKNRDRLPKETLSRIERHLAGPCRICAEKVKQAEEFLRFFRTSMKTSGDDGSKEDKFEACAWLDRIPDLMEERLSGQERQEVLRHMSECDECSEFAAVLSKARRAEPAPAADALAEVKGMWVEIRKGVLRLRDAFRLGAGISAGGFEPAFGFSGVKFRGPDSGKGQGASDSQGDIVSSDLELPGGLGSIKIIRILQKNGMKKLSIKPLEGVESISQIEIYDGGGRLLKSVDGFESASCTVSGNSCLLVINGTIEVPLIFE